MSAPAIAESVTTLNRPDGAQIAAYRWSTEKQARAIIVVAHGMGEHARRYPRALTGLMEAGYLLYGIDHRGHGGTLALSDGTAGDFGPGGIAAVVEDLHALVVQARAENPGLPLILLGHSMGSFIAQDFILSHSADLDGAVLVGTTALDGLAVSIMAEADIGAALNRNFEPSRTPFDWLSSDPSEVDRYIDDPLCGFTLTPESMMSLLSLAPRLADPEALSCIELALPIHVLVGGRDPLVCDLGDVRPLVDRYRAAGLAVDLALYPEGRHEILNESNRVEVVSGLRAWLEPVVDRALW